MSAIELRPDELFRHFYGKDYTNFFVNLSTWGRTNLQSGNPLMSVYGALCRNLFRTESIAKLPFFLTGVGDLASTVTYASDSLDELSKHPLAYTGLKTICAAIAINSWTTFESLATDLWAVAVNARPMLLGRKVAKIESKTKDGRNLGKSIPFYKLAELNFDIKDRIGDLLADRYMFTSLDQMRQAYEAAFGEDSKIARILADPKVFAAGQVRHVLTHRGGIVDQEFLDNTKGNPELSGAELNGELPLDAKLAVMLAGDIARLAVDLLHQVHGWLVANEEPGRYNFTPSYELP